MMTHTRTVWEGDKDLKQMPDVGECALDYDLIGMLRDIYLAPHGRRTSYRPSSDQKKRSLQHHESNFDMCSESRR